MKRKQLKEQPSKKFNLAMDALLELRDENLEKFTGCFDSSDLDSVIDFLSRVLDAECEEQDQMSAAFRARYHESNRR